MVDFILSAAAGQIYELLKEQILYRVNLVRGAEEQVRILAAELMTIGAVLDDAENRRFKDKTVNLWLSRLEQTASQMVDVLDEWNYGILKHKLQQSDDNDDVLRPPTRKVCFSSLLSPFKKTVGHHDISEKIMSVKAQLDKILEEKDRYGFLVSLPVTSHVPVYESFRIQTTSFIDLKKIHGRDEDRDFLVSKVLDEGVSQGESADIPVLSIVGVGGLGKTTLVQQVYNDTRVEKLFGEFRIWVCVSDPFDPAAIARGILENIDGSSPNTNQLHVLLKHVTGSLARKRFLLVLDDVWTENNNKWESLQASLRCGGVGSKILVTTRNERVARMMGSRDNEICRPGLLSNEDCWSLMCRVALFERNENEFKEIGMKIVQKCDGLPLAVKTLGSLLRFKKNVHEWENVVKSEIWEMKEAEVELFPHLLLSYEELSPALKRCFSYCAVYPKDFGIDVESLIGDWMALGYLGTDDKCDMELKGRNYFDVLAMRSLFQDFTKDYSDELVESCKMHDIVHDFAQFLRQNGRMGVAPEMNRGTCGICDPLLVSKVNEFCSLDCEQVEYPSNPCDCIMRLRVLSLKKKIIPQGMIKLIHLRSLKLFRIDNISLEDLKNIFQLYHLQTLIFRGCHLGMIPGEIKNLIHLRHLELSENKSLDKLPKEIGKLFNLRLLVLNENMCLNELPKELGNLIELRGLNLQCCWSLKELPESVSGLRQLRVLDVEGCYELRELSEGFGQLTSLRSLKGEFRGGSGRSKLGLLKKLNNLGGDLCLRIRVDDDALKEGVIVEDVGEAELRSKIHLNKLTIEFDDNIWDERNRGIRDSVRMDVVDALDPHPNLQELDIQNYEGSKLPKGWMVSPLNRLKRLRLARLPNLMSLPPLGRLPCLEELFIYGMWSLERVGREFIGIGGEDENIPLVAFPKLKELKFTRCLEWNEWEDITAEEEEEEEFSCMPSLTYLEIKNCHALTTLPHHLLRKATSLHKITIEGSPELAESYRDKEGPHWKSISLYNPNLLLDIVSDDDDDGGGDGDGDGDDCDY